VVAAGGSLLAPPEPAAVAVEVVTPQQAARPRLALQAAQASQRHAMRAAEAVLALWAARPSLVLRGQAAMAFLQALAVLR